MAPTSRKRAVARPPRRARAGASDGGDSSTATLQPIGEYAELPKTLSATSTGTHISDSPERKPEASRKKGVRDRDAATEDGVAARKKRRALELLAELETEVEKRCEDLVADAEHKARDLTMELKVQLMFLPESVRKMPWKTFIEDFGGSLANVIQNVKEQDYRNYIAASPLRSVVKPTRPAAIHSANRLPPLPQSTPAALSRRLHAFETPSFTPHAAGVPGTVLRTARRGETTYSIRGSPIVPDTVVKAPPGALVATLGSDSADPLACITLDSETAIDLSHPDMLSEASRAAAKAKIQALQAKLDALLMQFK